jgi:RNA ligase
MFPIIQNIDDVMPSIWGRDEFVVRRHEHYTFIDYNYVLPDTFDCSIRRECRGIKFFNSGELRARPLHKFFNWHEKPDENPDIFAPDAQLMMKLDGSMVHVVDFHGDLRFMTRAGFSPQAAQADAVLPSLFYAGPLKEIAKGLIADGYTPIFEYIAPDNRIVVPYAQPDIVLIAVRHNRTGVYLDPLPGEGRIMRAGSCGIVQPSVAEMLSRYQNESGIEGYVVRSGQRFAKIKTTEYVAAHKMRSELILEKDVLRVVLENRDDDVGALLNEKDREKLQKWAAEVRQAIRWCADYADSGLLLLKSRFTRNRREYAKIVMQTESHQYVKQLAFKYYDGKPCLDSLVEIGLKKNSTAHAREFLTEIGAPEWVPLSVSTDN